MTLSRASLGFFCLGLVACGSSRGPSAPCSGDTSESCGATVSPQIMERLKGLELAKDAKLPADVTNSFADDPRAAALGQKFFYEKRFSGPLLDEANTGTSGTLGKQGEAGKISCSGCHNPSDGAFSDLRSPRGQLSLGAGWTHRRAPSLLDVTQLRYLMWDGRRDSSFSQVLSPLESALELNSSRLFLAQQITALYKDEYEAIFGALPALDDLPALTPETAGCSEIPADPLHDHCFKDGHEDPRVMRIVANFGKAISAFTRRLTCGRGRFDEWLDGDESALTQDEKAGAVLFADKGLCTACHSGPFLTDGKFHNLGIGGEIVPFTGVSTMDDPGAAPAVAELFKDPFNSKGEYSDGDDGRLDKLPTDTSSLLGAFHTPGLRCVARRPSFMHNGKYRSLQDLVDSFSEGGTPSGYVGTPETFARNFNNTERAQLIAFLKALDGPGPDSELMKVPAPPAAP